MALEIERTFLARSLPEGLEQAESVQLCDIFFPSSGKAVIRLRKRADEYEITRKSQAGDASVQREQTVSVTREVFEELEAIGSRRVEKTRYTYPHEGCVLEIDVFAGELSGLVLIEAEFGSEAERDAFEMPGFCLADVTQESFVAGGNLAGKRYEDLGADLTRFGYQKIE